MATAVNTLLLDLSVSKVLPTPLGAVVGVGRFKVTCKGVGVREESLQVVNAGVFSSTGAFSSLVIRTSRKLTVTLTKPDASTIVLSVRDLLVLTMDYTALVLAYTDVGAVITDTATVSLIQS